MYLWVLEALGGVASNRTPPHAWHAMQSPSIAGFCPVSVNWVITAFSYEETTLFFISTVKTKRLFILELLGALVDKGNAVPGTTWSCLQALLPCAAWVHPAAKGFVPRNAGLKATTHTQLSAAQTWAYPGRVAAMWTTNSLSVRHLSCLPVRITTVSQDDCEHILNQYLMQNTNND